MKPIFKLSLQLVLLGLLLAATAVYAQNVTANGSGASTATTGAAGSTGGVGVGTSTNTNSSGAVGSSGGVGIGTGSSGSASGVTPGTNTNHDYPGANTSHTYPGANTTGLVNPPPGTVSKTGTNSNSTVTIHPNDPNGTNITNYDNSWNTQSAYWSNNFTSRPYYNSSTSYSNYEPAYRYGVSLYNQHKGTSYDDLDKAQISNGWMTARGSSTLSWSDANQAARDAYNHMVEMNNRGNPTH